MVRLSIPASFSFRDLALATVLATIDAQGSGPEVSARDELTSALCEAYNNIVLHAYRNIEGGRIDVQVRAENDGVEIHFFDQGNGFDMDAIPMPDLGELPESGMGIYIMRSFLDEVSYTRGGGGMPNVLLLRKRWVPVDRTTGDGADGAGESSAPLPDVPGSAPAEALEGAGGRAPVGGADMGAPKKETSQSGWRMRSVAVPASEQSIAGSPRRK